MLGRGAFGKVVLAQKRDNQRLYAIKILNKKELVDNAQVEHTLTEKTVLQHANHPFLVGLNYAFQTDNKLYFVLDFMKGGELYTHLKNARTFPEPQVRFYAACITLGLGHLHNKGYVYRDLKLENVLLNDQGYACLTDFGLSKFLDSDQKAITFCGTSEYVSPELILGKGLKFTADWWSLGVLTYEMLFGMPPFYSSNMQLMYRKIISDEVQFKGNVQASKEAKDFILKLLVKDSNKRLGAQGDSLEVLGHPWLAEYDIKKLLNKEVPAPFVPDTQNWERNFDEEFIQEKIRKSEVGQQLTKEDAASLEKFREDFSKMNFNKDLSGGETTTF